jgi:transcriptional regulator with XRE-family HTH domain
MERQPWQQRAREAGLSQKRLAGLLGISANALSKSLRGLRKGGVPRYIKLLVLCWAVMTPEQRRRVERDLNAEDEEGAEERAGTRKTPPD